MVPVDAVDCCRVRVVVLDVDCSSKPSAWRSLTLRDAYPLPRCQRLFAGSTMAYTAESLGTVAATWIPRSRFHVPRPRRPESGAAVSETLHNPHVESSSTT